MLRNSLPFPLGNGRFFPKEKEGYALQGLQIKNPYVGTLFFLVSSTLSCPVRLLFQNLSQSNAPGRPRHLAEIGLFDIRGLCYRIIAFLHWRKHRAGSRENRNSHGLFLSENSDQWLGNMGIVQAGLWFSVDRSYDRSMDRSYPPLASLRIPRAQQFWQCSQCSVNNGWMNKQMKKWLKLNHSG